MSNPPVNDEQRAAALRDQRFKNATKAVADRTQHWKKLKRDPGAPPPNSSNKSPTPVAEDDSSAKDEDNEVDEEEQNQPDDDDAETPEDTDEDSEETTTPPPSVKETDLFNSMIRWVSIFIPIVAAVRAVIKNTQSDADKK